MKDPIDLESRLSLRGKFPGGAGRAPRKAAAGRVCAEGACSTVLSIYNDGDHCWEHTPRTPYLLNVRRFRPARRQTA
jgi:hypothetical protein